MPASGIALSSCSLDGVSVLGVALWFRGPFGEILLDFGIAFSRLALNGVSVLGVGLWPVGPSARLDGA